MVSGSLSFKRQISSYDFFLMLLMACPILLYVTPVRGVAIYIYTLIVPLVVLFNLVRGVRANRYYFFLFFGLIVFVCFLIVYINSGNHKALLFSVNFVVSLGMAFLLFYRPRVAILTSNVTVLFLFSWYFYCLLFVGYSPDDANNYLYAASRNHVSFLLIISLILYYSNYIYVEKRFSLIPAILMVPVSVQLYGRSGILISVLLFMVVISYRFFCNRRREDILWGVTFLGVGFFILSFFLLIFTGSEMDDLLLGGFSGGLDSPRWAMAVEYFKSLNVSTFGFGSELNAVPLISEYNGNPHNSYIVGHSIFGIFFLVFLLFAFLLASLKLVFGFSRKRLALTSLFFILALRASSDSLFFYSSFDYIFIYLLILLAVGTVGPNVIVNKGFRQ